jgi:hypothetical protein
LIRQASEVVQTGSKSVLFAFNVDVVVSEMRELLGTSIILDWLANGGRMRMLRELKTNAGEIFQPGETVKLIKLEPSLVDHSYVAVCESEITLGKTIRIKETLFDAVEPIDY